MGEPNAYTFCLTLAIPLFPISADAHSTVPFETSHSTAKDCENAIILVCIDSFRFFSSLKKYLYLFSQFIFNQNFVELCDTFGLLGLNIKYSRRSVLFCLSLYYLMRSFINMYVLLLRLFDIYLMVHGMEWRILCRTIIANGY